MNRTVSAAVQVIVGLTLFTFIVSYISLDTHTDTPSYHDPHEEDRAPQNYLIVVHSSNKDTRPPPATARPPPPLLNHRASSLTSSLQGVVDETECKNWNCSCQGLSNLYKINHRIKSYGHAPKFATNFWRKHKCHTSLDPITSRPSPPPRKPSDHPMADANQVCYFLPTRPGDGRMEVILETWGRVVKDNIFFIMSKESDNTSYIDWEANEIHVAYRNFTNSRGEFVADYEPENLSGWQAPLVAKIMKFWEYMAMVYEQEWAHRCAWFVKTDDDTWLNAKLVQQRLECLDPDIELNFGYSCGFGVGVYTGYSRAVVRNMAYYINTLKPEVTSDWFIGDIEDRRVGQLLMRFGVFIEKAVRRNGTKRPDYMLWDKTYTKEQRAEWGRQLTKKQIGCLTFAHHSRPLVMKALTENLDSALKDTDGVACPSSWRKKGMTKKLIEGIAKNCPV